MEPYKDYTVYVVIKIKISSRLSIQKAMEDLEQNSNYNFEDGGDGSTTIVETEWMETSSRYPE